MSPETMLTIDELDKLPDISGVALYKAEVQHISLLSEAEEAYTAEAARQGDTEARDVLIHQCLRFVLSKAQVVYRDFQPAHTSVMDLIGQAHVTLLETMPNALASTDPVRYLMSVAAKEMKRTCLYDDPLIARKRGLPLTRQHPVTVHTDMDQLPTPEPLPITPSEQLQEAVMGLSEKKRLVLIAAYGLFGQARKPRQEIADELDMKKVTVDKYLYVAKRRLAEKLGGWPPVK